MRILFLIVTLLMSTVLVHAAPISELEALAKAKAFMQGKQFITSNGQKGQANKVSPAFKHLYIFNVEAGEGFVIVSGDDRTQSILGYAYTGEVDTEKMPCGMKWLLGYYDASIAQLGDDFTPSNNSKRSIEAYSEIPNIVETQWGQGEPYNALCPLHDGERCLTGCVATAMAQVMNHNRWPQAETTTIPSYYTSYGFMSELPAKQFNWDNMTNTSIAELMLYCGQAVKTDYTPFSSGASSNDVPDAMEDFFGYSSAALLVQRDSYTDEQWTEMIYKELQEGYPVLYFGQSATDGGHAFIVDGYSEGKYHINWGWNGYCDGYFTLDRLNPNMVNGFDIGQEMVINAWRPAGVEDTNRPKTVVKGITTYTRFLERTAKEEPFTAFTVTTNVESDISTATNIQTGLALYDDNGIVAMLSQDSHEFGAGDSYTAEREVTIGADILPGEYRIVSVNRINDSDPWLSDQGSADKYIAVTVAETSMIIQPMPKSDEGYVNYGIHTVNGITYHFKRFSQGIYAGWLHYKETEKYKGDLYIPDFVTYQNMKFMVGQEDWDCFHDSPELTSLSLPEGTEISNCPKLSSLEMREGVSRMYHIDNCPLLESITFPSSCYEVYFPKNCQNLKTITFLNYRYFKLWNDPGKTMEESLPSLTDIYINSDIPPIVEGFAIDKQNVTIHIPQGSLENYQQSELWKNLNLVEDINPVPVYVNWDYCGACYDLPYKPWWVGVGVGRGDNDVEFAMRIPAELLEAYKGNRITAIEYYTVNNGCPSAGDAVEYVFITSQDKDYITKQNVKTIFGQWMRIELNEPYTITGEDIFVGIGRHGVLGATWADVDVIEEDGFWLRAMGSDTCDGMVVPGLWEKNAGDSSSNHPLTIRALIEGESFPDDIVISNVQLLSESKNVYHTKLPTMALSTEETTKDTISRCFTYRIEADGKICVPQAIQKKKSVTITNGRREKKTVSFKVRNRSMRTVRQITFDTYVDGVQQQPITIDTYLPTNWEDNITIELPLPVKLVGRNHTITINVAEIDGKPDAVPANSCGEVSFTIKPTTYFPRKIVMEEATGTWCGWCPRGMVTIEQMNQKYPDNFIAIAIHGGDEMVPDESYFPFHDMVNETVDEVPSALINRKDWIDLSPLEFDIADVKDKGEAMVTSQAKCISAKDVEIETETVFGFSDNGLTEFRLAYVVTEDNVGPYWQANFYADPMAEDNPDDLMNWWTHQDNYVNIYFNEVARAIYSYDGLEGLLPMVVNEGEVYNTKYTLTLPDNINDMNNVKIVTLLLDTGTGEILNADRCLLTDIPNTGIDDGMNNGTKCYDIYNSVGMKVRTNAQSTKGLRKGLYIVNGKKFVIR